MKFNSVLGLGLALFVLAPGQLAAEPRELGPGESILVDGGDGGCGTFLMNADGSYENGYAWSSGGVVPPDYGAFAEAYSAVQQRVCSVVFDFSQTGNQFDQTLDVYVWDAENDGGGIPGAVQTVRTGVDPGPIAFWPSVSRHEVEIEGECQIDAFFVGFWGSWEGFTEPGWFIAADENGFGGFPRTKIAPGIGFPTGWQDVSVVWGPTQALGIGARVVADCETPTLKSSWGAIKALY